MKNRAFLGMVLFIVSEMIFFLMLVLAYVNFHKAEGTGASAASMLDPIKTGMFSIALLSSSVTMWLAEHARKRDSKLVGMWLGVTIALGVVFIIGQGLEYANLLQHNITISRDLFGTTFFTLTGFHGLHVMFGLLMLTLLFGLSIFGRKQEPSLVGMQSVGIYWHFVDAVWIVVFSVVYLWRYV